MRLRWGGSLVVGGADEEGDSPALAGANMAVPYLMANL